MNRNFTALREIVKFLEARDSKYALIGGIAVGCRGQARYTKDVDISVWVDLGDESAFIQAILKKFTPRMEDADAFAIQSRLLAIAASNGVAIDLALAFFPFEEDMLSRATRFKIQAGLSVNVLSAEDLIVTKAMAGRPQDWIDVQGICDRTGPTLNLPAIKSQLMNLAEYVDLDDALRRLDACWKKAAE